MISTTISAEIGKIVVLCFFFFFLHQDIEHLTLQLDALPFWSLHCEEDEAQEW